MPRSHGGPGLHAWASGVALVVSALAGYGDGMHSAGGFAVLSIGLLGLAPTLALGPQLVRGPYLQQLRPEAVVVRWRTDVPTDSRVRYGAAPGQLLASISDPALTTEHLIELTGLAPSSLVYYAVRTTGIDLAGDDFDHRFHTAPPSGSRGPLRIWVLGDSGTADLAAESVRDAFTNWNQGRRLDAWLMLGDNAYSLGTEGEYQAAVFDMYPAYLRTASLWPTFGNHDGGSASSATQTGPYYDAFSLPTGGQAGGVASGTEAYYSFDLGNVHFICLNSHDVDRDPSGLMASWLIADLAANTAEWTIAYWHHAPYTKGSHDSDAEPQLIEMREQLVPILEAGGVDLVLAGHSHSYERSVLIDGHYGLSGTLVPSMILDGGDGRPDGDGAYLKPGSEPLPNQGTVYVVAGTSGRLGGGSLDHPVMEISFAELGSLVLDIHGRHLRGTFVGADGSQGDHFGIDKAGIPIFADGFEGGDPGAWSAVEP